MTGTTFLDYGLRCYLFYINTVASIFRAMITTMQHIVKDGVQQFISGAGAFSYQVKPCDGLSYGNGNDAGFLRVDDNSFTFIDRHGTALYSANL